MGRDVQCRRETGNERFGQVRRGQLSLQVRDLDPR